MHPNLDQDTMDAVLATFKANDLVVVSSKDVSKKFIQKRRNLMKQKWVSACAISDYNLLDSKPSRNTVKNMIENGTIPPQYVDRIPKPNGTGTVLSVMTLWIKEVNNN